MMGEFDLKPAVSKPVVEKQPEPAPPAPKKVQGPKKDLHIPEVVIRKLHQKNLFPKVKAVKTVIIDKTPTNN